MKHTKIDYEKYRDGYSEELMQRFVEHPEQMTLEDMRNLLYGYTFTQEYAEYRKLDDRLFMDYWRYQEYEEDDYSDLNMHPDDFLKSIEVQLFGPDHGMDPMIYDCFSHQEMLLLLTIESSGNGLTAETAKHVIDVHQEYEYLDRVEPYDRTEMNQQALIEVGIDCLSFDDDDVPDLFFNVSRRYAVGFGPDIK